jgi:hypothetical protein
MVVINQLTTPGPRLVNYRLPSQVCLHKNSSIKFSKMRVVKALCWLNLHFAGTTITIFFMVISNSTSHMCRIRPVEAPVYPLVNSQFAIENGHRNS